MTLIQKVQAVLSIMASMFAISITFFTIVDFTAFLSDPNYSHKRLSRYNNWTSTFWSLFINQFLLSIFILQHSLLALPEVKNWLSNSKLRVIQRCLYVISSAAALQVLLRFWHKIPGVTLWTVNSDTKLYWWIFITIHILAWLFIYVGSICMDVNELFGIKQIYYSIQQLPDPNIYKSSDLKRLYAHMRHPSFIGFLIIFWVVPCMTLDRALLASVWSCYMYLAWNTDNNDYNYQQMQHMKKYQELNYIK